MNKAMIKKLLIDKNKTQLQMALDLNISRQYLWMHLTGRAHSHRVLSGIAEYFGLGENELFPK